MQTVIAYNPPVAWVKARIEDAGNTIGSVHFNKRSDNTLRKLSYRLHVKKPSVASVPKGLGTAVDSSMAPATVSTDGATKKLFWDKKRIDEANSQMTVLDANKVVRDAEGKKIGRGAWRTVPLEKVVLIKNKGTTYEIKAY